MQYVYNNRSIEKADAREEEWKEGADENSREIWRITFHCLQVTPCATKQIRIYSRKLSNVGRETTTSIPRGEEDKTERKFFSSIFSPYNVCFPAHPKYPIQQWAFIPLVRIPTWDMRSEVPYKTCKVAQAITKQSVEKGTFANANSSCNY